MHEIRFALRLLARQPLVTATAVLTVALAVGANAALYSVLETMLLRPLGIANAERIVWATVHLDKLKMRRAEVSGTEYGELRAMKDTFEAVSAMEGRSWTAMFGGEPVRLTGRAVTPEYFRVFDLHPALGRFPTEADESTLVISHALWRQHFGSAPDVVGRILDLDGKPHRIIGVAPAGFQVPANAQAWSLLSINSARMQRRGYNMNLTLYARLKDGAGAKQAMGRVNGYVSGLLADPAGKELRELQYGIDVEPFSTHVAGDLKEPLWILWAAAITLLVIGCANVAGLLLSRTSQRRREIAVRISIGATRGQIVRQLLTESLILAALGGAAGLALATLLVPQVAKLAIPSRGVLELVQVDWRLFAYGFGLALLSGLAFGLAPAIQLARDSQIAAMARARRHRFQSVFAVAQVAAAFVLLVASGLLLRSMWTVQSIKPGFDIRNLSTAFFLRPNGDPTFLARYQQALRAAPGVESAALAYPLPFSGGGLTSGFRIRNREHRQGEPEWHGEAYLVSGGYFDTLRIPVLRGRGIADSDVEGAPVVCVIDSRMAERFFPNQDPIGQEISMYRSWARVVGIVPAVRGTSLEESSRPTVYYSLPQIPYFSSAAAIVRSPTNAGPLLREVARQANGRVAVFDVRGMEDRMNGTLGIRRTTAQLLTGFALLGALLAAIGLHGVAAQLVAERLREIGVRMALGARPVQILSQYLGQGVRAGAAGLVIGIGGVTVAGRWIKSQLYQVEPFDPVTFVAVAAGILCITIFAVLYPARRASRVDPVSVLRQD